MSSKITYAATYRIQYANLKWKKAYKQMKNLEQKLSRNYLNNPHIICKLYNKTYLQTAGKSSILGGLGAIRL